MSTKLKRAVIKEELVALTGNFKQAILLNQMIYWSERVKDFDSFISEENERAVKSGVSEKPLTHGWIYKKAEELSNETMLGMSPATVGRQLEPLIEKGWLETRQNPEHKWDRTIQYRVNLINIQKDLFNLGYHLEGYKADMSVIVKQILEMLKNGDEHNEISNFQNENTSFQNENAIPEITTETTTERKEVSSKEDKVVDFINKLNEKTILLDKRNEALYSITEGIKNVLINQLNASKEKEILSINKVDYSAPISILLHALLSDSKTRQKYGLGTKVINGKKVTPKNLAKVIITYLKVHKKIPNTHEIEAMEYALASYPPAAIGHGIRISKNDDLKIFDNSILPYIAEAEQQQKAKNLEIFGKKTNYSKPTHNNNQNSLRDFEEDVF